jgi:metal-responsive CopG/Arc/MetJ family transcriptional regulator
MPQRKQIITIRLPKMIVDELDRYVDGVTLRNRAHAFHVILAEWLESQRDKRKGEQTNIAGIKPPSKARKKK